MRSATRSMSPASRWPTGERFHSCATGRAAIRRKPPSCMTPTPAPASISTPSLGRGRTFFTTITSILILPTTARPTPGRGASASRLPRRTFCLRPPRRTACRPHHRWKSRSTSPISGTAARTPWLSRRRRGGSQRRPQWRAAALGDRGNRSRPAGPAGRRGTEHRPRANVVDLGTRRLTSLRRQAGARSKPGRPAAAQHGGREFRARPVQKDQRRRIKIGKARRVALGHSPRRERDRGPARHRP